MPRARSLNSPLATFFFFFFFLNSSVKVAFCWNSRVSLSLSLFALCSFVIPLVSSFNTVFAPGRLAHPNPRVRRCDWRSVASHRTAHRYATLHQVIFSQRRTNSIEDRGEDENSNKYIDQIENDDKVLLPQFHETVRGPDESQKGLFLWHLSILRC